MILIGQFDSPFVRRVGIALTLYDLPFEHRPWSVFGDAGRLAQANPLRRVPTLICDDGVAIADSHNILDYLDGLVGPERALFPAGGIARRDALRIAALATGLADKAVSLFYELHLHEEASQVWTDRCKTQISETLALLESECTSRTSEFWFGDTIGHADIATACVLRFVSQAHVGLVDYAFIPALASLCERCEDTDIFRRVNQPFIPPA